MELESGFEWRRSYVMDRPGFGLAAINKTSLVTCIDNSIVIRKYTK